MSYISRDQMLFSVRRLAVDVGLKRGPSLTRYIKGRHHDSLTFT